jgi:hypothetical protein
MSKATKHVPGELFVGGSLVVHYLESPNAIRTEAPGEITREDPERPGCFDVLVRRPGRNDLRLFAVPELDPKALPANLPAWTTSAK